MSVKYFWKITTEYVLAWYELRPVKFLEFSDDWFL